MRRMILSLAAMFLLAAPMARAGDAEVKAAQSVIESQLQAFRDDDAARAYSYAAPSIKRIFPTKEAFMSMVTNGYPPVHRAQSHAFGKVEETGASSIMQQVLIVGPDGKDYEAVYTLERQPDGSYLITGCSLRASNSLST